MLCTTNTETVVSISHTHALPAVPRDRDDIAERIGPDLELTGYGVYRAHGKVPR